MILAGAGAAIVAAGSANLLVSAGVGFGRYHVRARWKRDETDDRKEKGQVECGFHGRPLHRVDGVDSGEAVAVGEAEAGVRRRRSAT